MDENSLDSVLAEKLPEWFGPLQPMPGPLIYVLLLDELQLQVTPDEVRAALDRLVKRQTLGLRWYPRRRIGFWEQEYVMDPSVAGA